MSVVHVQLRADELAQRSVPACGDRMTPGARLVRCPSEVTCPDCLDLVAMIRADEAVVRPEWLSREARGELIYT